MCGHYTQVTAGTPPAPPPRAYQLALSEETERKCDLFVLFGHDLFFVTVRTNVKSFSPPWFYSRLSSHRSSSLGKPGKHVVSFGLGFTERRRRKSTSQATVLKGWSRRGRRTAPRRVHFTFVHITPTAVTSRCFVVKSKDASL